MKYKSQSTDGNVTIEIIISKEESPDSELGPPVHQVLSRVTIVVRCIDIHKVKAGVSESLGGEESPVDLDLGPVLEGSDGLYAEMKRCNETIT